MVKWGPITKGAGGAAVKRGWGLKYIFYFVFVFIMLAQALSLSYQAQDITPGLTYLGNEWIGITHELNDKSLEILNREEVFTEETNIFKKGWFYIKSFWDIIQSLFILYIWLKIMGWIIMKVFIWDDSKTSVSYLLAIIGFALIQIIVILFIYPDTSPNLPIVAFVNLFKALTSIVIPSFVSVSDKVNMSNFINISFNKSIG